MAITSFFSLPAANNIYSNPNNKPHFGIRFGVDANMPSKMTYKKIDYSVDYFNNGAGLDFGGYFDLPIVANLYFETGLNLSYDTYSVKKERINHSLGTKFNKLQIKRLGFRVPALVGYHFDVSSKVKLLMFVGPELDLGLMAKEYAEGKHGNDFFIKTNNLYTGNQDEKFRRINVLGNFGAGVAYDKVRFTIDYHKGFLNTTDSKKYTFRENKLTFGIGIDF